MKPCPVCTEIVRAIAGITALTEVSDNLKLFLVGCALDYEPHTRKRRRKRRVGQLVKLVPTNSDPPRAS
jgi:hypothetical protein